MIGLPLVFGVLLGISLGEALFGNIEIAVYVAIYCIAFVEATKFIYEELL